VLSHAPFLAEFLTTGRLGRIQLGMDLAEVVTGHRSA